MALFISYSSRDRAAVENLRNALHRARQQVCPDVEPADGEGWWQTVLEQIRSCEVFVIALSDNSLASKSCQAELGYARALDRPILPVQVGPISPTQGVPFDATHIIDYRTPTVDDGIQLIAAVHERQTAPPPLPSPLPDESPMPFAYLTRLAAIVDETALDASRQAEVVSELKSALESDGDDPIARRGIEKLLCVLRDRADVSWHARTDVESVLAGMGGQSVPVGLGTVPHPGVGQLTAGQYQPQPGMQPLGSGLPPDRGDPPGRGRRGRVRWLVGLGVVGIAAAAIVAVTTLGGGGWLTKRVSGDAEPVAADPEALTTQPTAAGGEVPTTERMVADEGATTSPTSSPTTKATPLVTPERLQSILLPSAEVNSIMGASNMQPGQLGQAPSPPVGVLSDPDCRGAFWPGLASTYEGSGYVKLNYLTLSEPDGSKDHHYVDQDVAAFPSAGMARTFVENSARQWSACGGQTVKVTDGSGSTYHWTFGKLSGDVPKISQYQIQEGGEGWACQHVLSTVSNVVIDVNACGSGITDQGARIADGIAANITG